jgi:hypothetical protein
MTTEPHISQLLEMRLRARGNPVARAIIDQCLVFVSRAATADPAGVAELESEVRQFADDLALRFGAPKSATVQ